ncbi:MAG: hypothetical protein A3I05_01875 [Deltaproteobacteria bacterium RIFCSPLOWO2_02_FULL_44_10]|nr:MAG: hypothetical protein A3C46_03250 [Deltaproteobacteria bacterium RIFCSPHIGHO2_02_FULL_44_16]OGQ47532.1 MAG: hypothetical protein A3I05_01875 [Deltaproteobacteria bacterium RIFCSPLOWO2_02_FULL_44_10]
MNISVLTIGKLKSEPIQALVSDYLQRLQHYVRIEMVTVRNESEALTKIKSHDMLIVCDERGKQMTSLELSSFLEKQQLQATKRLCFFIGDAQGHSENLRSKAHALLSFSKMTLPHEFAHVVLLEQLYRAYTILKGEPYHK